MVKIESIKDLNFDFDDDAQNTVPHKSRYYFAKRYFDHPLYRYLIYKVCFENNIDSKAVVVLRKQEIEKYNVLRFIDFVGPVAFLGKLTSELDRIMKEFDSEYIDLYETGVEDSIFAENGWIEVKKSNNIIPNYFSPYEERNVDINYCSSNDKIIIFKGDGDQDRPN